LTVTPQPAFQYTSTPVATFTPAVTPTTSCPKALSPHISSIGVKAEVVYEMIPLRSSPKVTLENILQALPIGTELEIIKMPVCAEFLSGANLWWGVKTMDGKIGWAAEGSAIDPVYYLQEIK